MGRGGGAALGGPVRRAAATGCSGLYRRAAPAGRRWVLCPIRTPGRDALALHPGKEVDAAALISAASTTRTAQECQEAGRRLPAFPCTPALHRARNGPRRPGRCPHMGSGGGAHVGRLHAQDGGQNMAARKRECPLDTLSQPASRSSRLYL